MTVNENSKPLLTVKGLKQYFKVSNNYTVHAVENVSFQIYPGETYGLVGESGSGKSTIGRSIIRLYDPTAGEINFNGMDISGRINKANSQALRTQMQMIFQDPMASLNPRKKVRDIIGEGLDIHHMYKTRAEREEKIKNILAKVGLAPEHAGRYPHQFSGGQRQRIGIARSLAVHPKFVVCDEAVSALDVSIQSQIINLLLDLKEQNNLTYLFISHDLSVIKYISDRIGVMYLGNMMELSDTEHLFAHPYHPYTEALLSAIPTTDVDGRKETIILEGDIPSPINPPKGCKFHTRCRYCTEICKNVTPQFEEVEPGHFVACHHKLGVPEEK